MCAWKALNLNNRRGFCRFHLNFYNEMLSMRLPVEKITYFYGKVKFDAKKIEDVTSDSTSPSGPPCQVDDDCKTVFVSVDECKKPVCVPLEGIWGECRREPKANGEACDDGNACTLVDACLNGQCESTEDLKCDDGNSCTADKCDPDKGCIYSPVD